jgi:hypothetical protein
VCAARSPRSLGAIPYITAQSLFDTPFCHSKPLAMGTDAPTDGSPTLHRLNDTLQTTPSTQLSTSAVHPQGTSGTRFALDEAVDRILDGAKSRLEEGDAKATVETLEKVSGKHLLPTDRCTKPVDDRCWIPALKSTYAQGDDVSGDS